MKTLIPGKGQTFPFFLIVFLLLSLFSSSCGLLKLPEKAIGDIEDRIDTITMKASAGLIAGIDTIKLKAIVGSIVDEAGSSLNKELDSLSFTKLKDSVKVAVFGILSEGMDSLQLYLSDTTAFNNIDAKLQSILSKTLGKVESTIANMIPMALNDANTSRILALRDSLLGAGTTTPLENLLDESLTRMLRGLRESGELDSLINRIDGLVDNTTTGIEKSTQGISKTVKAVGITIGIILLALSIFFAVLWWRKRGQAKQQKDLLVNLTKAIDAIPSREDYDQTIATLQESVNSDKNPKQSKILKDILAEYKDQYTNKKKYSDEYQELIALLKKKSTEGNIDDPELQAFIENK